MSYNNGVFSTFNQNASITNIYAVSNQALFSPPNGVSYGSVFAHSIMSIYNGGGGTISNAYALAVLPSTIGTITNVYGLSITPTISSKTTTCYGAYIQLKDSLSATTSITNEYGLYIDRITSLGISNAGTATSLFVESPVSGTTKNYSAIFNGLGQIFMGSVSTTSAYLNVQPTLPLGNSLSIGMSIAPTVSIVSAGTVIGMYVNAINNNGSISNFYGELSNPSCNSGTLSNFYGFSSQAVVAGGTVVNAYGGVFNVTRSGGSVKNAYGLQVLQPTGATTLNVCADFKGTAYCENGIVFAVPGTGGSVLATFIDQGTFLPTAIGATAAGSATYQRQVGFFTRIGNLVFITVNLQWTGNTGTGNFLLGVDPTFLSPAATWIIK